MSSTPDMPNPTPPVKPKAPLINNSGYFDKLNQQKEKKGFLSTFLGGRNTADVSENPLVVKSTASRLSEYLGQKTKPGVGEVKK